MTEKEGMTMKTKEIEAARIVGAASEFAGVLVGTAVVTGRSIVSRVERLMVTRKGLPKQDDGECEQVPSKKKPSPVKKKTATTTAKKAVKRKKAPEQAEAGRTTTGTKQPAASHTGSASQSVPSGGRTEAPQSKASKTASPTKSTASSALASLTPDSI